MKLQDSVIAITGSGQGLGRAMAEYLAAKGARLALIDLTPEKLAETAEACKTAGSEAKTYVCNVAKEDEVEQTFAAILKDFGQLNGLVNNAGILRDSLLVKVKDGQIAKRMELSQWQAVIDVNLTGVFLCGREAATQMIKNDSKGVIINIASISRAGNMGQSNYSAAKAGVSALVPVWAKELARYGIRCMGIAPGFVGTEMTESMRPDVLEKLIASIPLKRMGTPEEIASTVAFIFENDYLSGRMIEVDGALRI
ncbi:3-oxoacyl-[acyl-carrier protein] reductase [Marinobacter antarcticus]|uniref:2,3-dihydroxy-2,3-dihydro-p-cumate dehydrogenase n=1 Tax=Marinobacter antarcticus TaxID=564117 RepID=A0A1M6RYX3_9GAMM|nr:SDR family oxidoreductase [Marinobacter antarcticus]SHK37507.1 3-oxoacyl-[acyl-carrier protein] reductase [Marinobacter antarcticus]